MLQLRTLNRSILQDPDFQRTMAPPVSHGEGLERHVDDTIRVFREERVKRASTPMARLGAKLDAALRTDAVEHMDEPGYSEWGKLGIALGLHGMNVASASYRRFFSELLPMLRTIEAREGRPARVLELASGSGGFAFALDALARKRGVRVQVTASDVVPLYISRGQKKAAKTGSSVEWRHVDALDMKAQSDGAFDIVFIAQSVHHFSPGSSGG